jgi:hypothetical protein
VLQMHEGRGLSSIMAIRHPLDILPAFFVS